VVVVVTGLSSHAGESDGVMLIQLRAVGLGGSDSWR